jgi:hypothetical protein
MSGPNVYQLIAAVSAELAAVGIKKNHKNQSQNFTFRGIDDVYNTLAPLMARHGLVILPRVTSRTCDERAGRNGGSLFFTTVEVQFDFVSSHDGSKHTVVTYGEAMDSGDKSTNKAMSAAYKYACFQAFCIPVEGDNDADAHTHEVAPKRPAAAPRPAPAPRPVGLASEAQLRKLWATARGVSGEGAQDELKGHIAQLGLTSSKELTSEQVSQLIEMYTRKAAANG